MPVVPSASFEFSKAAVVMHMENNGIDGVDANDANFMDKPKNGNCVVASMMVTLPSSKAVTAGLHVRTE